jgi:hypothetical protein
MVDIWQAMKSVPGVAAQISYKQAGPSNLVFIKQNVFFVVKYKK